MFNRVKKTAHSDILLRKKKQFMQHLTTFSLKTKNKKTSKIWPTSIQHMLSGYICFIIQPYAHTLPLSLLPAMHSGLWVYFTNRSHGGFLFHSLLLLPWISHYYTVNDTKFTQRLNEREETSAFLKKADGRWQKKNIMSLKATFSGGETDWRGGLSFPSKVLFHSWILQVNVEISALLIKKIQ